MWPGLGELWNGINRKSYVADAFFPKFRNSEHDVTDSAATVAASTMTSADIKATSPIKSSSQRRPKIKKNASTCTSTSEVGTITNQSGGGNGSSTHSVEIESDPKKSSTATCTSPTLGASTSPEPKQDKLQIVNERKYPRSTAGSGGDGSAGTDDDVDSENEKLSPLLSPGSKGKNVSSKSLKQVVACLEADDDVDNKSSTGDGPTEESSLKKGSSMKRTKPRPELSGSGAPSPAEATAEDSDYYTPEDTQNSILSPLCPTERAKSGDPLGAGSLGNGGLSVGRSAGSVGGQAGVGPVVVGFSSAVKKNLHKKSTSVGNMVGSGSVTTVVDLKSNNVSSLPGWCF